MENNILERFNSNLDEIWDAYTLMDLLCNTLQNILNKKNSSSYNIQVLGTYARQIANKDWIFLIEKHSYLNVLRMCCTEEISLEDALQYFTVEKSKLEEVKNTFSTKD